MRFTTAVVAVAATAALCLAPTVTCDDTSTLQYALVLENLEAAFYNYGVPAFKGTFGSTASGIDIETYLTMVQAHENAHVAYLQKALGSTAVPACTPYPFNSTVIPDIATFLTYAAIFENVGVSAYDGAINTLSNPMTQMAAATIATIEARHASWLAETIVGLNISMQLGYVNGTLGMYNNSGVSTTGFDTANTPVSVANLVAGFLTGCSSSTLSSIVSLASNSVTTRTNPTNYGSSANNLLSNITTGTTTVTLLQNDINTANYALTLEHLEAAFYNQVQANMTDAMFTSAGFPAGTYAYLGLIAAHENAHVTALTSVIGQLGAINASASATAAPACGTYNWGQAGALNATQVISTAVALENVGVTAYDGAIGAITAVALAQAAATIATVEGRHSTYLNALSLHLPTYDASFNNTGRGLFTNGAFDATAAPSAVVAAAANFIYTATCPAAATAVFSNLPVVLTAGTAAPTAATPAPTTKPGSAAALSTKLAIGATLVAGAMML